jgi:hypothetical protein
MDSELKRVEKKVAITYVKVMPWNLHKGLKKPTKTLESSGSWEPGHNLNATSSCTIQFQSVKDKLRYTCLVLMFSHRWQLYDDGFYLGFFFTYRWQLDIEVLSS